MPVKKKMLGYVEGYSNVHKRIDGVCNVLTDDNELVERFNWSAKSKSTSGSPIFDICPSQNVQ
jgi:hypothetical protein